LYNINQPITAIQRILGYEKRTTTEKYLHSFYAAEKEAMVSYERVR
jgi:hypothetical protein